MEPKIAKKGPFEVSLESGKTYYWCACGQSKNQPFCDGSHKSTEFTPVSFTAKETGTAYLCGCKRSGNKPFCDGTHNKI
ncbi:MAG TPA: CDGSH iron-sulfur domain-containing protein [Bacteroidales bacterium]|nr:CDGSH iron-sulfur domain-containing protein [Bacteroidales bacterium]